MIRFPNYMENFNKTINNEDYYTRIFFPLLEKIHGSKIPFDIRTKIKIILKGINPELFSRYDLETITRSLAKMIVSKLLQKKQDLDIKDLLKEEIGIDGDNTEWKMSMSNNTRTGVVNSFLGFTNVTDILNAVKLATIKARPDKIFITLDSYYRNASSNGSTVFTWNYFHSTSLGKGIVNSIDNIKNIKKIKFYPFKIPQPLVLDTIQQLVSVQIQELSSQAYVLHEKRKFHALFKSFVETSGLVSLDPYELSEGEFIFNKPITKMDTISITFADPIAPLTFDKDRIVAKLAPNGILWGAQTILEFTEAHGLVQYDLILIDTFFTTDVILRYIIKTIENRNANLPYYILTVVSPTQVLIDLDTSSFNTINYSSGTATCVGLLQLVTVSNPISVSIDEKLIVVMGDETYNTTVASIVGPTQFNQVADISMTEPYTFYQTGGSGLIYKHISGTCIVVAGDDNIYTSASFAGILVGDDIILDLGTSHHKAQVVDYITQQHIKIDNLPSISTELALLYQISHVPKFNTDAINTNVFIDKRRMFIPLEITLQEETHAESI